MDALTSGRPERLSRHVRDGALGRTIALAVVALLAAGLLGRILTYPLQHDEQFYLPPGLLLGELSLYRDIGFTHLPNLPLLVSALVALTGPAPVLLVGRLLVAAAWLALLFVLFRTGRAERAGTLAVGAAAALILFDSNLLGEAGMAATNNFLPIPFAIGGVALFLAATRQPARAAWLSAASGLLLALAAGFKINFAPFILPVALATLLVPREWPLRQRIGRLAVPMLVGGLIGAAPTLTYLVSDPAGFLAHAVDAHRGPQIAYWLANPDPADPKVIGLGAKLILARELWLSGTSMLMLVLLGVFSLLLRRQAGCWHEAARAAGWPVALLAILIAIAAALAFPPTPAFPQYFVLPFPFAALLILLLHGRLDEQRRDTAAPVLVVVIGLAVANGAPSLLPSTVGMLRPQQWASTKLTGDSDRLTAAVRSAGTSGPVATLEPLQTLAGGLDVVPELALGPFIYRAGDRFPPEQSVHYRYLASPGTIGPALVQRRPAAVLVGRDRKLEAPLEAFARANGYRLVRLEWTSGGKVRQRTLFVAPPAGSAPRPLL